MAAFCYMRSNMHDESLDAIDRYLALNPGSKDIDYAYYMKGVNYFNQISDVQRDQSISYVALKSFNEVINRFSESDYATDAAEKVKVINDRLAGKELNIASNEVAEKTAQDWENYSTDMACLHLKAIRSILDSEDPSYKN